VNKANSTVPLLKPIKVTLNRKDKKDAYGLVLGCNYYIKEILPNSVAASEANLKKGDILLKLNDLNSDQLSLVEATKIILKTKENKLHLTVKRNSSSSMCSAESDELIESQQQPPFVVNNSPSSSNSSSSDGSNNNGNNNINTVEKNDGTDLMANANNLITPASSSITTTTTTNEQINSENYQNTNAMAASAVELSVNADSALQEVRAELAQSTQPLTQQILTSKQLFKPINSDSTTLTNSSRIPQFFSKYLLIYK
jgi:hypothetical protein